MKFDIRIPISPTETFFRRVEYLVRSVRASGGETAGARFFVSVGADIEPFDIYESQPWSRGEVVWRWVDRELFRTFSYHGTVLDRFFQNDADIVLLADADVIFVRGVDDVLQCLSATPAIAGFIAPIPPFVGIGVEGSWREIFAQVGLPFPADLHQHNGYRIMFDREDCRLAPAYFNMGAVFVPGRYVAGIAGRFPFWLGKAQDLKLGYFASQLALTFVMYDLALPRVPLQMRYNYLNDPAFERHFPQELADVRILHYLRTDVVDRDRDLTTPAAVRDLIARSDLTGSNEIFRQTVERLSSDLASAVPADLSDMQPGRAGRDPRSAGRAADMTGQENGRSAEI